MSTHKQSAWYRKRLERYANATPEERRAMQGNKPSNAERANQRWNRKLAAITQFGSVCFDCEGKFHPAVFEFHHKSDEDKDGVLARMWNSSQEKIDEELSKCIMLCANCHRLRHHGHKFMGTH